MYLVPKTATGAIMWLEKIETVSAAIFAALLKQKFLEVGVTSQKVIVVDETTIELLNGIRRFLIRRHLDESEAFAAACITVGDDFGGLNASRLSEDFLQRLIRRIERKVANV